MDMETDQKIRRVIREHLRDRTVLAIAHRIGDMFSISNNKTSIDIGRT